MLVPRKAKGRADCSQRPFEYKSRRRPTFPHSCPCSIIGPARLNFRVRDGNGCDPRGMITRKLLEIRSWKFKVRGKNFESLKLRISSFLSSRTTTNFASATTEVGWHYKLGSLSNATVQNWRLPCDFPKSLT